MTDYLRLSTAGNSKVTTHEPLALVLEFPATPDQVGIRAKDNNGVAFAYYSESHDTQEYDHRCMFYYFSDGTSIFPTSEDGYYEEIYDARMKFKNEKIIPAIEASIAKGENYTFPEWWPEVGQQSYRMSSVDSKSFTGVNLLTQETETHEWIRIWI